MRSPIRTTDPMATTVSGKTVLQVIPALDTGGAERTTVDIAAALVAEGARALVVSAGGRMVPELEAVGARHLTLPVGRKSLLAFRENGASIADIVEREGVDLVHARSRAPAWASLWATRWTRTPFVTTYHGAYSQKSRLKGVYNGVMARGDVVIANSAFTADLVRRRHPFARNRIVVVHRGTDLAAFADADAEARGAELRRAWNVLPRQRVILHLARLTPWKGQTVLIEALARYAERDDRDWVAILAGDDQGRTDYRRELEALIERRGLDGKVKLVGHVEDVPAAMATASLAVVPSTEPEAFGRAAVEAQAAGVPVVVSDLGAVRETVLAPPEVARSERSGWRVPAGEAGPLAEAIYEALTSSRDVRREIGARGRAHVWGQFSLEAMKAKTLAVYGALLNP